MQVANLNESKPLGRVRKFKLAPPKGPDQIPEYVSLFVDSQDWCVWNSRYWPAVFTKSAWNQYVEKFFLGYISSGLIYRGRISGYSFDKTMFCPLGSPTSRAMESKPFIPTYSLELGYSVITGFDGYIGKITGAEYGVRSNQWAIRADYTPFTQAIDSENLSLPERLSLSGLRDLIIGSELYQDMDGALSVLTRDNSVLPRDIVNEGGSQLTQDRLINARKELVRYGQMALYERIAPTIAAMVGSSDEDLISLYQKSLNMVTGMSELNLQDAMIFVEKAVDLYAATQLNKQDGTTLNAIRDTRLEINSKSQAREIMESVSAKTIEVSDVKPLLFGRPAYISKWIDLEPSEVAQQPADPMLENQRKIRE